jgi:hypothetical protein
MKFLILISLLLSFSIQAKEFILSKGEAEYTVKHLVKTVKGKSTELKGKMVCNNGQCQFLFAAPVKSFVSSDSNRDLNMQTVVEAAKFPMVVVKGMISEAELAKPEFSLEALVSFHGVEKNYAVKVKNKAGFSGVLPLKLEAHKVERPSLLTVEIDDDVPVEFSFSWNS